MWFLISRNWVPIYYYHPSEFGPCLTYIDPLKGYIFRFLHAEKQSSRCVLELSIGKPGHHLNQARSHTLSIARAMVMHPFENGQVSENDQCLVSPIRGTGRLFPMPRLAELLLCASVLSGRGVGAARGSERFWSHKRSQASLATDTKYWSWNLGSISHFPFGKAARARPVQVLWWAGLRRLKRGLGVAEWLAIPGSVGG